MKNSKKNWFAFILIFFSIGFLLYVFVNKDNITKPFPAKTPQANEILGNPVKVVIDAGNPLVCNILPEPKTFGGIVAEYSCEAPGSYLTSIDQSIEPWSAGYFTSSMTTDEVTYGPISYTVIEAEWSE